MISGIFPIYKPKGMTSHDVVDEVRRATGIRRVGHGGTLDPLAEGVLVIAVGRENTKLLDKYVKGEKEYGATLKLGYVSETDDSEGPIQKISDLKPKTEDIRKILEKFTGKIMQTPPMYSAIKIHGKPAYKYARQELQTRLSNRVRPCTGSDPASNKRIELKPREVFIKKIEIVKYDYPLLELRIECGSGVYIRSLARDIGNELKTGAYLTKLVRTRVGEFKIEDSLKLEGL